MQNVKSFEETELLLGIRNDIRYRPFLSFTTLRIIGLIIFGITQLILALYIGLFTIVIPVEELTSDSANTIFSVFSTLLEDGELSTTFASYKDLVMIWPIIKSLYTVSRLVPPLLIVGLFGKLIQTPNQLKGVFIKYLVMTLSLFIGELIFYYLTFDSLLDKLAASENIDELIVLLIKHFVKNVMIFYSNLNIFIDMLIAVIFFKFYMTSPKSKFFKRHLKLYRSFSLFPVIYILLSTFLIGFEKVGHVQFPLVLNSLLSARGIFVYAIFFAMCMYFRYRFPSAREKGNYIQILNRSNLEIYNFTVFSCFVLLMLSLISKVCAEFSVLVSFRLDYGLNYFYLIPWILLYNYTIKPRFKYINIFYGIYYLVVFFVLFGIYLMVIQYAIEVFKVISNTFS